MNQFKKLGAPWPPRGWKPLDVITDYKGQTLSKDPRTAKVTGISFIIEPTALQARDCHNIYAYRINIAGWEYNIQNESREFPILSFTVRDRIDRYLPKEYYLEDIKSKSRPIRVTERSAHRAVSAAVFIIKQINTDAIVDTDRVLRLYKIHPSQRSLYDIDNVRADSLHCGLPYGGLYNSDQDKA
jgi:hypothetical protein